MLRDGGALSIAPRRTEGASPIKTRSIGASGVSVSVVGLGGYELGPEPGEQPEPDRAVSVIRTALESGVDWLDTSENYLDTQNESLIGVVLAQVEDDVLIASKAATGAGVTGGGSGSGTTRSTRRAGRA